MVDPERNNTPGDAVEVAGAATADPAAAQVMGPVAAGPMAVPPGQPIPPQPLAAVVGANAVHVQVEIDAYGRFTVVRPGRGVTLTPEERQEQQRQRQEEENERQRRLMAAERRSKELMTRLLTDEQRTTFTRSDDSHIVVTAESGRRYRINCGNGYSGNVYWLGDGDDVRGSFCIYPRPPDGRERLPRFDAFLGQLLLLQTDEVRFLNIGIFHGPVHPIHGRRPHWDW